MILKVLSQKIMKYQPEDFEGLEPEDHEDLAGRFQIHSTQVQNNSVKLSALKKNIKSVDSLRSLYLP
jgi:hypothetical protein